jgi:hypothetical protein
MTEMALLVPIFGIIFTFGTPVILVAVILYYRMRKTRLLHETIAKLVEKGLPIPEALLSPESAPRRKRSDLRTGIILIAVGLGLTIFFYAVTGWVDGNGWAIGIIPLLIGLGYVVAWKLEPTNRNDAPAK